MTSVPLVVLSLTTFRLLLLLIKLIEIERLSERIIHGQLT